MQFYYRVKTGAGSNHLTKDLPSVLILITADQILNDSLCCFNKCDWYLRTCTGKL